MLVGIISDTHGLLRPEVFTHFEGVEHILHAGDIGSADLLTELEAIAPVTAVWGNTDGWEIRARLPEIASVELEGVGITVVHGQQFGSPTPESVAAAYPNSGLVVFGHSHRAVARQVGDTLALNPGSAGPRRFGRPATIVVADVLPERITHQLITLVG